MWGGGGEGAFAVLNTMRTETGRKKEKKEVI